MIAIYVTSTEARGGKTTLCAGIGKGLADDGKRIAFLKPVFLVPEAMPTNGADKDTAFISEVLEIEELSPLRLTRDALREILGNEQEGLGKRIQKAYAPILEDKDVAILEGLDGLGSDNELTQAAYEIISTFEARVIIIVRYSNPLPWTQLVHISEGLKERLLGVVINRVPLNKTQSVRDELAPLLQREGIKMLGLLPEDRLLLAPSMEELAEHLGGRFLTCPQGSDELVENVMVGAMCVDPGPQYFGRKANKAVVVRGERPDMQLAALETPTRCLILSGNTPPLPVVQERAEDKGVPLIAVESDTLSTIAGIEIALNQTGFHSKKKLLRLNHILGEHFDFEALYRRLGL